MEYVKAFMFARWIAIEYDGVLNKQDGRWYAEQLNHFEDVIFPQYLENGSFAETALFLQNFNKNRKL